MRIGPLNNSIAGVNDRFSSVADKIAQMERAPLDVLKVKKDKTIESRTRFQEFAGIFSGLGKTLDGLATEDQFSKLKVESSHPDYIDAVVGKGAKVGSYELELNELARVDRHVEMGFKNITNEVGFGYFAIEKANGETLEFQIDPGSSIKTMMEQINSGKNGIRAEIINSGISDEPYKLLVSSVESGEAARFAIDPDTTFGEFKNNVVGQNLKMNFEDIPIERAGNKFEDLIEGVKLNAKQAAPGTKIQINVSHDIDQTKIGIQEFVDNYNKIAKMSNDHFQSKGEVRDINLSSALRTSVRQVQSSIGGNANLAQIGITTDAKTGALNVNAEKLTEALSKDYEGVRKVFASSEGNVGLAEKLSNTLKGLSRKGSGILSLREESLNKMIRQQDQHIETQERRFEAKQAQIQRQFQALETKTAMLDNQSSFLQQRFEK